MSRKTHSRKVLAGLVIGVLAATGAARADSPEDMFHRAYYLEHAKGDMAAAAKLYEEVGSARKVDAELKSQAQARLAVCREELASSDLARLMPPDAFAYLEIQRPGEHVARLLETLGLLAEEGDTPGGPERRVAVSPDLIEAILGMRGIAVAINGFDPQRGEPDGVVVFHPGDVEVIRGLIETALPIGGQPSEPIEGFATYFIEEEVYVTLTRRLVILSPDREQIDGVVGRLIGKDNTSLASDDTFAELARDRSDSLLYFCVNAEPIMPMIQGAIAAGCAEDPELAMVNAILDPQSLRWVVGRFGVNDGGLFAEVELRLKEGHHNLVYNFFRTPPIDPDTFRSIPHGAAAFVVGALNEVSSRHTPSSPTEADSPLVVTGLDFGREIFGNIAGFAVYALPPEGPTAEGATPIPDIGAAITVNDPSRSEALWTQILGIASIAAGAPTIEGETVSIDGVSVRGYRLPEDVTLYFATVGQNVLVASSRSAMARSIDAQHGGKSIRDDAAFAKSMSRVGPDSTKAVFAHPARCAEIAKPFMSERERKEMEPFLGVLTDTVVSLILDHSGERFCLSAEVSGIPEVGGLLTEMIGLEQRKKKHHAGLDRAIRHHEWDKALGLADTMLADGSDQLQLLRRKFDILATGQNDRQAALVWADTMFKKAYDDANALNNFAWALLTEDKYQDRYNELALKFSERSNEITQHNNWAYLDTLALAKFVNGDAQGAVALEEKAIVLAGGNASDGLKKALARFKAGVP